MGRARPSSLMRARLLLLLLVLVPAVGAGCLDRGGTPGGGEGDTPGTGFPAFSRPPDNRSFRTLDKGFNTGLEGSGRSGCPAAG